MSALVLTASLISSTVAASGLRADPFGKESAGTRAVIWKGIGTIDPATGKALDWDTPAPAAQGGQDFLATAIGLGAVSHISDLMANTIAVSPSLRSLEAGDYYGSKSRDPSISAGS